MKLHKKAGELRRAGRLSLFTAALIASVTGTAYADNTAGQALTYGTYDMVHQSSYTSDKGTASVDAYNSQLWRWDTGSGLDLSKDFYIRAGNKVLWYVAEDTTVRARYASNGYTDVNLQAGMLYLVSEITTSENVSYDEGHDGVETTTEVSDIKLIGSASAILGTASSADQALEAASAAISGALSAGSVTAGTLTVNGDETVSGNGTVGGDLSIGGSETVAGNQTVFGNTETGSLSVKEGASVGGNFAAGGDADLSGNVSAGGSLSVAGSTELKDTLIDGSLTVTKGAEFSGGKASIDENGRITAESGYIGGVEISNGQVIGEHYALTADGGAVFADGAVSADGDGTFRAADGKFVIYRDGTVTAVSENGTTAAVFSDAGASVVSGGTAVAVTPDGVGVNGNTGITGNLAVSGNLGVTGDTALLGNASVAGNFAVAGSSEVGENLTVKGNASVGRNLEVAGNTALLGNASVAGDFLAAGNAEIGENLAVKGSASVGRDFSVSGNTALKDTAVDGDLSVAGNSVTAGNAHVGGSLSVGSSLVLNGASGRISGLAAGEIAPGSSDAVNGSQLYDVRTEMRNRASKLGKEIAKAGAGAAALAALHPQDYDEDHKFSVAAALGHYKSREAVAVGAFIRPTENLMLSAGYSASASDSHMVNVGLSYRFGGSGTYVSPNAMKAQLADQDAELRDLAARNEALMTALSSLEARVAELSAAKEAVQN